MAIRQTTARSQFGGLNVKQSQAYVRAANKAGAANGYTSARHSAGMAAAGSAGG